MAETYAYQQNFYEGASVGYVKYNVTPDLGTPVAPGETIVFTGVAYSKNYAAAKVDLQLQLESGSTAATASAAVSIPKAKATAFEIRLVMPAAKSFFPTDGRTLLMNVEFGISRSDGSGDVLTATTTQQAVWLRYRINPQIVQADFFRYGIDPNTQLYERKNDGLYCMCSMLKIKLGSGYTVSDITVAQITTEVQRSVINIPASTLATALADGYSEQTGPQLFAWTEFATDTNYKLTIVIGDEYDVAVGHAVLPRSFANMCLCNFITGGVCFGGFPKSALYNPLFENYYPMMQYAGANFYNGIGNIQAGLIETLGNTSSGSYKDGSVTFPKPFAAGSVPIVVISFRSSSTAGTFGRCCVSVLSTDNTGFTFRFFNGDSSARSPDYTYIAFGVPA